MDAVRKYRGGRDDERTVDTPHLSGASLGVECLHSCSIHQELRSCSKPIPIKRDARSHTLGQRTGVTLSEPLT